MPTIAKATSAPSTNPRSGGRKRLGDRGYEEGLERNFPEEVKFKNIGQDN
jgi:hypothetical protein